MRLRLVHVGVVSFALLALSLFGALAAVGCDGDDGSIFRPMPGKDDAGEPVTDAATPDVPLLLLHDGDLPRG
jgi:hypothetical protein